MSYPVYGVAIATLDGIRAVLAAAGAATAKGAPVQWYNMREEPCIYIAGRPFVLREAMRPLANLCECACPCRRRSRSASSDTRPQTPALTRRASSSWRIG